MEDDLFSYQGIATFGEQCFGAFKYKRGGTKTTFP